MLLAACWAVAAACEGRAPQPPTAAVVARVIDGDTLELAGGQRVRLLGLDAPELGRDGRPAEFLAHQAREALAALTLNRQVRLEYDRLRYDQYGRLLAYLRLPDGGLVNLELVRRGLSRVYLISPNLRYREELLAAQQEALAAGRGVWPQLLRQDEPHYLGNRSSRRFHRPACPLAADLAPAHRVRLASLIQAYREGYSPCRSCRP
jgi:micrococcal nuclease